MLVRLKGLTINFTTFHRATQQGVTAVKLNDPFGRVSRREQHRYKILEQRLRDEGVLDADSLQRFTRGATATILKLSAMILVLSATLALVFPGLRSLLLVLDVLLLLWLSAGYLQTRLYLKRYRRENFHDQ